MKQIGISPKLIADLIVSIGGYLLVNYGAGLDPTVAALIGKALGSVAAYIANPGFVVDPGGVPAPPEFTDEDLAGREGVPLEQHVDLA